ncbi:8-amino-7-oxononanoate synthase (plasmid) [Haloferax mediterranei ATCC 33500]|uniref:8-amino-7-oxononanoate synthase n=1 Tax=Haloferax mediterranei (strain ATCC 33500 / DSM 1411 / JCM 8866 / NBRC 14739 / NCIMB 2177 / R-4) TaxID=523841 RepID=I3R9K2_HALMT|nr:8-amino-7-oxononanoate synthase [Haloferax mediterranei]AFK20912.1 8-amino-7-oxononanoate synthase [Haloferax mediterranei ATCC 33500]AHZ24219.1 8-amino-7-oxononanoate synthase [Haloferax mediterranei ATCC 33500]EMA05298.1 8-amino-7-oxononanoate synthase [Haloferax mediterranei ATCC 33500]MDX5989900.1 8-amino-7-oxononanoate synthase [Haloferax mediterranei ATCC 33500]QCQ77341.1 8-amino-7-oxononanoate synthase [Haloferax mediterranei ATCC 33500]
MDPDTTESQSGSPPQPDRGFDLESRLEARQRHGLRRELEPAADVSARTRIGGESQLVFAANNYLGLATDSRVQQAAASAAHAVGTGSGASRLITGDTELHRELEGDLAAIKHTDRTLLFSSGYAANVGTIAALDPDVIFSDELNHASIIDGCRLSDAETVVYDHCDAESLATELHTRAETAADDEQWLIATDTVFSMDGDVAPLAAICDLAERYGAWVLVDEAHATGLYENGGGLVQREGLSDRIDVQIGTLSKALASQGGYVAGSETLIEYLVNEARSFVFSTGLAPPAVGASKAALRIARDGECRKSLWENVETLRDGLESMGYRVLGETQVLPVLVGDRADAIALDERLREQGIVAPVIRPPTVPDGTSRIRVAPMATHTEANIDRCLTAFETVGTNLELI